MSTKIIFVMMTASTMSRDDFENSQISTQDTLFGVAVDDIMHHILVYHSISLNCLQLLRLLRHRK